ncbi:MAG: TlyA family RNA methyltransferase [Candidatus Poribacteria bacterium]
MLKKSERIDVLLVQRGLAPSRERAKQLIMAGNVFVNDQLVDKPGNLVSIDSTIVLKNTDPCPYVSRGGLKLKKAIDTFNINVKGKIAIDVGASTGGFTDCLLQNGVDFVYAIDVGYGQIDWKIRNDKRVEVIERTNIRYVKPDQFQKPISLVVIDVSFISLDKVIPVVNSIIQPEGDIIALIKPQFEAGREFVRKGIVKDPNIHRLVIKKICDLAVKESLNIKGLTFSPIKGSSGNIEFLIWLKKSYNDQYLNDIDVLIDNVINESKTFWSEK